MQCIRKGFWICVVLVSAAKSLQSCPTLSDTMDCSLPGSSVHVILQARTLECADIAFSNLSLIFQNIFNIGSELWGVLCHTRDSIFCLTPGEPNHIPFLQSGVARNASDGWRSLSIARVWLHHLLINCVLRLYCLWGPLLRRHLPGEDTSHTLGKCFNHIRQERVNAKWVLKFLEPSRQGLLQTTWGQKYHLNPTKTWHFHVGQGWTERFLRGRFRDWKGRLCLLWSLGTVSLFSTFTELLPALQSGQLSLMGVQSRPRPQPVLPPSAPGETGGNWTLAGALPASARLLAA